MTASERILTLHPGGKQGVNIEVSKYEGMRAALLKVIPTGEVGVPFRELSARVEEHLDPLIFGPDVSRNWYVTTVKQDLEARGLIAQLPGARPQRLRRVQGDLS